MAEKDAPKTPEFDEKAKAAGWTKTATKPIVAPDGHETLSQEDIDNRG